MSFNLFAVPSDNSFDHALWRKYILTILFGNMVCMFDFIVLLHLSNVISAVFFPSIDSPIIQNLKVVALFGVGFLSRPLGSLLIGRFGDRHGRKPALMVCLLLFALCAIATSVLPTYAQVGILAPILFVCIRLIQGLALGTQMTLGWVFIAEHAPRNKIALYSSVATASFALANLLAYFMVHCLEAILPQSVLIDFGWRIPFIIGGFFSVVALVLERKLSESPLFLQQAYKLKQNQLAEKGKAIIKMPAMKQRQAIFLTAALAFVQISLVMMTLMTPKIISMNFRFEGNLLTITYVVTLTSLILGCLFFGWLADKTNVGRVMIGGAFALILQALIFYIYLDSYTNTLVLMMCACFGFASGIRALCPVVFVQLFPTSTRLTFVSVIYSCVAAVLGIALPSALLYFTDILGAAPGLYLVFLGIVFGMLGLVVHHSPELN